MKESLLCPLAKTHKQRLNWDGSKKCGVTFTKKKEAVFFRSIPKSVILNAQIIQLFLYYKPIPVPLITHLQYNPCFLYFSLTRVFWFMDTRR